MKVIFTFLLIIIFWLDGVSGAFATGMQKHKEPAMHKTAVAGNTHVIRTDSASNYSINVNGGSNSVLINNQSPALKSSATGARQKNKPNSIEINGEANSVSIHQSKNGGQVNIQQTGIGNQVSISQTNQNTVK